MCDAGMDGDMHNPNTSSGKWIGSKPYYVTDNDGIRKECWDEQSMKFISSPKYKKTIFTRIKNALKELIK